MAEQTENTNNPIVEETKEETKEEVVVVPVPEGIVKLVSSDSQEFEVPLKIAIKCKMVATGVEGYNFEEDGIPEVALPNINGATLARIVEFLNLNEIKPLGEIQQPLRTKNLKDAIPTEHADLIQGLSQEQLFELTLAANYIDCPPLLELCSAAIAIQIKGMKSCKEIADHFGLKREYKEPTVDDIERLRKKYPWMDKQAPI